MAEDELRDTVEYERLLEEERLILQAQELLCTLMERDEVSRAELARRIGSTRAHITQLLSGNRNLTLRTLAGLSHALGHRVALGIAPVVAPVVRLSAKPRRSRGAREWALRASRARGAHAGHMTQVPQTAVLEERADIAS